MSFSKKLTSRWSHWNRLHTIAKVFAKHGFASVLYKLGYWNEAAPQDETLTDRVMMARRLRMAFEELGPTFVKLGQVLTARPDIIPEEFIHEFSKLTDSVPPFSLEEVDEILLSEFGRNPEEIFETFDRTPLAAASIAQVHRATLKDTNERVVVKIQRPGIEKIIQNDVQVLHVLAQGLEKLHDDVKWFNLPAIIQEFQRTISDELDFHIEARSMDLFHDKFKSHSGIKIPQVIWSASTKKVLTMSELHGRPFSKIDPIPSTVDRAFLLDALVSFYIESMLQHGVFHADLHSGNVLLIEEDRGALGILDFGMVGTFREDLKQKLTRLFWAFAQKDFESLALVYTELGEISSDFSLKEFQRDIEDFLGPQFNKPISEINAGQVLMDSMKIARKYQLKTPKDLVLFYRSLITLDHLGRVLDPQFTFMAYAPRLSKFIFKRRFSPEVLWKDLLKSVDGFRTLGVELPVLIKSLSRQFDHDRNRDIEKALLALKTSNQQLSLTLFCLGMLSLTLITVHFHYPIWMSALLGLASMIAAWRWWNKLD